MIPMTRSLGNPRRRPSDLRASSVAVHIGLIAFFALGTVRAAEPPAQRTGPVSCNASPAATLEVTAFGAKADSMTDNTGPLSAALAYAARCNIHSVHVPAGAYLFKPRGPTTGILLPSQISLVGDGIDKTVLVVSRSETDDTFASFLWARNQDNIEIRGITFRGSNAPVSDRSGHPLNSYGSAITIVLDASYGLPQNGVPRNLSHFVIAETKYEGFNGTAWVSVRNYNAAFTISDVEMRDSQFYSQEGNAVNPGNIGFTANAISINGSLKSADGLITQVNLVGNRIEGSYIKGGIAIWSGVRDVTIAHNSIINAGAYQGIPNDRGAYAITVYNNAYYHDSAHAPGAPMGGTRPDNVTIESNEIRNPKSCGIYVAGAARISISDNDISGQTDPENHTLPKGAIALNQPLDATVTNNRISRSHIAMSLYEGNNGHISASGNQVTDIPPGGMAFDAVRPQAHETH